MPFRVLVHTNVVLDLILAREPWFTQAKPLWDARDAGQLDCAVLASALTDLYYICRKPNLLGPAGAKVAIEMVIQRFEVLTVDRAAALAALALPGLDFEDNLQMACAVRDHADLIITRDTKDFQQSPVLAIEPADIANHLSTP